MNFEQIAPRKSPVQELAAVIRNSMQLQLMLQAIAPKHRREMYDALKPHLQFVPKPYFLLKFARHAS